MSSCAWNRPTSVLCRALAGCIVIAGCSLALPLKATFDEPPLFPQIRARVGSACAIPIHKSDYADSRGAGSVIQVDFDQASLSRFEQVFRSLFSEVTQLPPWPPWRETPPALDGVIELDQADLTMTVGDDLHNPDRVTVSYRVCLYTPEGSTVNCWENRAEQIHQRAIFERSLSLDSYLATLVETASREAIARFMLAFEKDPTVKAWAARVAVQHGAP